MLALLFFSIVPKKEPNSFRLIHNLSFSDKSSLYDITDKSDTFVQNSSFDDALLLLRNSVEEPLWQNLMLNQPLSCCLLTLKAFISLDFNLTINFISKMSSYGLHSFLFYFQAFSSFLNWIIDLDIGNAASFHYLDHFLFISYPNSVDCLPFYYHWIFRYNYEYCNFGIFFTKK